MIKQQHIPLVALWLLLVVISLLSRSYIPIDETRYVTVAWNMWLRGDFLVPYLNNIPYSHKPPLLFWLMNAGWSIFGINDWWPRLVPSLFALASLFLTSSIATRLWPRLPQVATAAPVILVGCALWMVFSTATMFDMLVAFFTLLGMLGMLITCQDAPFSWSWKGWLLLTLAIGGGLLAKGPTILLQLLPLALLAPWWAKGSVRLNLRRWYSGVFLAVLAGAAIALLWAIPAGIRGGAQYQHAIFWGQTAERMVHSFAHRRAFWWYLPLLPVMLFPWLFWLSAWRGLRSSLSNPDFGVRFCLAWLIPAFVAFSAISGKQMHYLLPLFPAFALLLARSLHGITAKRWDMAPAALIAGVLGALVLCLPFYAQTHPHAPWLGHIPMWNGILLLCCAALLLWRNMHMNAVWKMTLFSSAVVVISVYSVVIHGSGGAYDLRPIAAHIKTLQDQGIAVAHEGKYPGQYQFLGRLRKEPDEVASADLSKWFAAHPDGKAIVYFDSAVSIDGLAYEYMQLYKGDRVVILGKQAWPPVVNHRIIDPSNG